MESLGKSHLGVAHGVGLVVLAVEDERVDAEAGLADDLHRNSNELRVDIDHFHFVRLPGLNRLVDELGSALRDEPQVRIGESRLNNGPALEIRKTLPL